MTLGLAGKICRLDLSKKKITIAETENYSKFIGGRGLASQILFDELERTTHPYDPENLLVFSSGLLVATGSPLAVRINISGKNANTFGIGYSNAGGNFATQLKKCGYDALIISGKSQEPVLVTIINGDLQIKNASHMWGKTTVETEKIIRNDLGNIDVSIASIGPAGENLTFASAIIIDSGHAAAGCALGSVMGSKKLKGIAVCGDQRVHVADPVRLEGFSKKMLEKVADYEKRTFERHKDMGTYWRTLGPLQEGCVLPVRNYQDDHWDEDKLSKISYDKILRYRKKVLPCEDCPMPCIHYLEIETGKYSGTISIGFQGDIGSGFGTRLDIDDPEALIKINAIVNAQGIDIENSATIISWAFELFENKLIDVHDTGGLELRWGNSDALIELLYQLAHRREFGSILADGFKSAIAKIGKGSGYYAMQVKGHGIIDSIRTSIAYGLGHTTSVRGARHLDGSPTTETGAYPPEVSYRIWGVPTASFQCVYEGKAKLVFWYENFKALTDALGICYLATYWRSVDLLGPEDYAELYKAVTGENKSPDELLRIGWQIHEIEKAFNTLHANFTRVDDLPPMRAFLEPVKSGKWKGQKLDWNRYNQMLDEYYELHGWSREDGRQKKEELLKLGLGYVAERLGI